MADVIQKGAETDWLHSTPQMTWHNQSNVITCYYLRKVNKGSIFFYLS